MALTTALDDSNIKAILEKLRSSQAWQDAVATTPSSSGSGLQTEVETSIPSLSDIPSGDLALGPDSDNPSVASLLLQLQAPASSTSTSHLPLTTTHRRPTLPSDHAPLPAHFTPLPSLPDLNSGGNPKPSQSHDVRNFTFQQSLPHLVRLSQDPNVVSVLKTLKKEQEDLERKLWGERRAIQRSHEDKVELALKKAKLTGGAVSQYERDSMTSAFRKELERFDAERALRAWDGLTSKQQSSLEALGVPTMFPSSNPSDRVRQQRVMQVLIGVAE